MKYNHFSMLPEQAFQPRGRFGMTLEGGGNGSISQAITPSDSAFGTQQAQTNTPYTPPSPPSAGGGFMGRGPVSYPTVQLPSQQPMFNPAYQGMGGSSMVNQAYQNILGRAPEPSGYDLWTNRMQQGLTGQGLVAGMTTSPEFQRQQEFNRAYTEAFRPGYKEFSESGQYQQPIHQSSYARHIRSGGVYSPSYAGPSFQRNPFAYAEGGDISESDAGIAGLMRK